MSLNATPLDPLLTDWKGSTTLKDWPAAAAALRTEMLLLLGLVALGWVW
jgi:hypothetical protein